jgi:hypothetical protein
MYCAGWFPDSPPRLRSGRGCGRHEDDLPGLAVHNDTEIELPTDVEPLFDIDFLDFSTFGTGLVSDQRHAQHLFGELLRLVGGFGHLDAPALAAATGMNLCLDDNSSSEFFGSPSRFILRMCNFTARNANAVARKDLLGLVLMDLHRATSKGI